jgi:hypothetical protein
MNSKSAKTEFELKDMQGIKPEGSAEFPPLIPPFYSPVLQKGRRQEETVGVGRGWGRVTRI